MSTKEDTMTMSAVAARGLRTAHDTDARLLSRKPKHELAAILRSETGAQGIYSKDEMVSAILAARGFGIEKLNEAIHVLHHEVPGEVWPDCPHCQAAASSLEHCADCGHRLGTECGCSCAGPGTCGPGRVLTGTGWA
jgi:hypothetical protein